MCPRVVIISFADAPIPFADAIIPFGDAPISFVDALISFADAPIPFRDGLISFANALIPFVNAIISLVDGSICLQVAPILFLASVLLYSGKFNFADLFVFGAFETID